MVDPQIDIDTSMLKKLGCKPGCDVYAADVGEGGADLLSGPNAARYVREIVVLGATFFKRKPVKN